MLPLASVPKGAAGRGAPAGEPATGVPAHRSAPGDQARALPGAAPIRAGVGADRPTGRDCQRRQLTRDRRSGAANAPCGTPVPRADESRPGADEAPAACHRSQPDGPKGRRQRHWDEEGLEQRDTRSVVWRRLTIEIARDGQQQSLGLDQPAARCGGRRRPKALAYRSARSRFRAMASFR